MFSVCPPLRRGGTPARSRSRRGDTRARSRRGGVTPARSRWGVTWPGPDVVPPSRSGPGGTLAWTGGVALGSPVWTWDDPPPSGPGMGYPPIWTWDDPPPIWTWDGVPPPSGPEMGFTPHLDLDLGWGYPPSPVRTTEGVLATRRAVCLLRSRRRTFLYILFFLDKNTGKMARAQGKHIERVDFISGYCRNSTFLFR